MFASKRIQKVVGIGLSVAVVGSAPLLAQQAAPLLLPKPVAGLNAASVDPDKEVALTRDGTFRLTVLTTKGNNVGNAQVVLTSMSEPGKNLKLTTGPQGKLVVGSIRPGLYRVQINSRQGGSDGTILRVDGAEEAPGQVASITAFTVTPGVGTIPGQLPEAQPQEGQPRPENADAVETEEGAAETEDEGARRRRRMLLLLGAGGAAAVATAIAVPLALAGDEDFVPPPPVVSP
jgi:hypothetical protein